MSLMRVKVQYLGILREFAGRESETLEVQDGATLGQLYASLQQQSPAACGVSPCRRYGGEL